jgi:uncharacterized protein (TIGR00269 family)
LYIISKYFRDTNKIVSITIDEGIEGYRNKTIETMKHFCAEWGVQYRIYSYKEYSGMSMDKITRVRKGIPCSICGVFRRQLLNSAAKENRVDKLATAHNMDDEAESVIMNLFQNDFEKLIRLGPTSGLRTDDGFVSRIKPFIFINEKETAMFAFVKGINALHTPCPYSGFGFRGVIAKGLRELETTTTGAKRNIVNRMLELKAGHATIANSEFLHCSICGAPSSGTVCGACAMKRELANKA